MAQLAIKGHATRGSEVIELLEMLGGKNNNQCCGAFINRIYFINEYGYIESCDKMHHLDYIQLSLEEFLEKYPYKVGDKVLLSIGGTSTIKSMYWSSEANSIRYKVNGIDDYAFHVSTLQPYKEETMEEPKELLIGFTNEEAGNFAINPNQGLESLSVITFEHCNVDEVELNLSDKFEIQVKSGKTYVVRKKSQYPKTYGECYELIGKITTK